MKKIFFISIAFLLSTILIAQDNPVKQGSRLLYIATVNGNSFPMFINIDSLSENNCSITWNFDDGRSGRFFMKKNLPDSATLDYWNPPVKGEELLLPAIQNILFLSRPAFASLQKNKTAAYDDYMGNVDLLSGYDAFTVKDKLIGAMFLKNEYGAKIWVMNNSAVPLILKIEGNPYGVDLELINIE